MSAEMEAITPIVPVTDEATSLAFYCDVLGFEARVHAPDTHYALAVRDNASVILLGGADEDALAATRTNISAYVWVKDLDGLWSELSPSLNTLPEGRVRPPFTQDYGMREFHVKDPDGFLILFGEDAETKGEN